jgi:hypothetical protein
LRVNFSPFCGDLKKLQPFARQIHLFFEGDA